MNPQLSVGYWLAVILAWCCTVRALLEPGCQVTAPKQKSLKNVRTTLLDVPRSPFGLVYSLNEDVAFVALNTTLGVLNTTKFAPSLLHQIPLPAAYAKGEGALGIALTHNGHHVLVSASSGAIVVDVAEAMKGNPAAVVGALNGTAGSAAIEVTITADDEYAFLSQEYGTVETAFRGTIEVFKLHKATATGAVSSNYIGYVPLGEAVVGTALSPDGSVLYATSEAAANGSYPGYLSVLDVKKLKTDPSKALISNVTAGCGAVRIVVSSDGKTVWVTARESNHLLAFDAAKLVSHPSEALVASVQVGTSPVGLTFAHDETRILTANSNRFEYTNTTTGLSVVDVKAALEGKPAVLGSIPTGLFPREFATSPNKGTILVADYASKQIQAVDVATIP